MPSEGLEDPEEPWRLHAENVMAGFGQIVAQSCVESVGRGWQRCPLILSTSGPPQSGGPKNDKKDKETTILA
jgi:hypothetical protein